MSETAEIMKTVEIAAQLLMSIWTQIDPQYKMEQRRTIWEQMESNTANIANMSSTLPECISRLCGKFSVIAPGDTPEHRAMVWDILTDKNEQMLKDILRTLQKYPQLCVLQMRIWNDQKKETERMLSAHVTHRK